MSMKISGMNEMQRQKQCKLTGKHLIEEKFNEAEAELRCCEWGLIPTRVLLM